MDRNERIARILVSAAWADHVATAAEREVLARELAEVGWTLTASLLIEWPPAEDEAALFDEVQALAEPLDHADREAALAGARRVLRASAGESYRESPGRELEDLFESALLPSE